MEPTELITYCGGYGGHCARYIGYKAFREDSSERKALSHKNGKLKEPSSTRCRFLTDDVDEFNNS